MAAVVISPPQLSSMVMAMPRETQRSRACRALRQATELADFDVDHIHGAVGMAAEQGIDRVDHLVEDEWVVAVAADRQAFIVGAAGLFDVDVDVADRANNCAGRRA